MFKLMGKKIFTIFTLKKFSYQDTCNIAELAVDPQEWSTWRSGVRSAKHAASQLPVPERRPTESDVDDAPATAC